MPLSCDLDYIVVGKIGAPYGIKGYNHVQSYSDPLEQILQYTAWMLRRPNGDQLRSVVIEHGRVHAQSVVVKLQAIDDRDAAQLLTGSEIVVLRSQLAPLEEGEYYWESLEGLRVDTVSGVVLGQVQYLYKNAGQTNMVVLDEAQRERHIPFIEPDYVTQVSLAEKKIIVDWDPEL